jgi:RHS repeat-associated protein
MPVIHDNPLVAGETTVQARHITELRDAIDALRSHLGLAAYSWQTPAVAGGLIKADPILEMRTALDQALGAPSGGYSPNLAQGQPVKAIHIQELRDRVQAAWDSSGGVQWLVSDQLGTPRMVFEQGGALSSMKRHDYLPFGEEIQAGTGGRTTAQGYSLFDGVRQHYTGAERDDETGLDFMQARYYASTQGRFTSPDPLLSSGRVTIPQSWNRYVYTLNNPLKYTDPFGLYEAKGLSKGQIAKLEEAIDLAEQLRDRYEKGSDEYNQIDAALKAIGRNGDGNGVAVRIGGDADDATTEVTKKGVTVYFGKNVLKENTNLLDGNSSLLGKVVHEGTHVSDGQKWRKEGEKANITEYTAETRAYMAEVNVAKKWIEFMKEKGSIKGAMAYEVSNGDGVNFTTIYESTRGWKEADSKTAIGSFLKTRYNLTSESKSLAFPTTGKNQGRP